MTITGIIIGLTCLVSYLAFNDRSVFQRLMHHPYTEAQDKEYYRLLTSGFVHGSLMHLLLNMYVLYEFGTVVEHIFVRNLGAGGGRLAYVALYLITIIAANIPTHLKHRNSKAYAAIGASGGVSGILFSFVVFAPWSWLGIMFVVPCPAIIFAVLYLAYSSWASKYSNDNIGHDAHFYGALFGFLMTFAIDPSQISQFVQRLMDFQGPGLF